MSVPSVPLDRRAQWKLVQESLATHPELEGLDLAPAVEAICGAGFSTDVVVLFATITHRGMGIGRFCLIHNHQVDTFVLEQQWDLLRAEAAKAKEQCVEIYHNALLSDSQQHSLKKQLMAEFTAVKSALSNYSLGQPELLMPCTDWRKEEVFLLDQDQTGTQGHQLEIASLTERCHETICLAAGQVGAAPLDVTRTLYLLDRPQQDITPIQYCYDLLELLHDLSGPVPARNRYSGEPFDPVLEKELRHRYEVQLKMMACYHQWLDSELPVREPGV